MQVLTVNNFMIKPLGLSLHRQGMSTTTTTTMTFVRVLCFVNVIMMLWLQSPSIDPILWQISSSFSIISRSCKSLFIMLIADFATDTSVSFSRLLVPSVLSNTLRHVLLLVEFCFSCNTFDTWFARASWNEWYHIPKAGR